MCTYIIYSWILLQNNFRAESEPGDILSCVSVPSDVRPKVARCSKWSCCRSSSTTSYESIVQNYPRARYGKIWNTQLSYACENIAKLPFYRRTILCLMAGETAFGTNVWKHLIPHQHRVRAEDQTWRNANSGCSRRICNPSLEGSVLIFFLNIYIT